MRIHSAAVFVAACLAGTAAALAGGETLTHDEAAGALRRAVSFFRTKVSAEGGYLWRYSADLTRREGENKAGAMTAWVQPPGTPSIGQAYLDVFELTGDKFYLDSARETAGALVRGQLLSGGWDYRIEFDPRERRRHAYRADGHRDASDLRNTTTLDDNTTQSALQFLMQVDRVLKFQDADVHQAAEYALAALLKAQYPNGGWPQRYSEFPDPERHTVKKAAYPETWSKTYPGDDYRGYYTFNDNSLADVIETMLLAAEIYGEERYRAAAEKAGDFILLAQMPDPQPAWAQQYDRDMHPAWARKFEPPSITGGESRGILRTLMFLYRQTGKQKYLEPIPRAVAYFKQSRLPDGRFARFYELKTNRPLYFTKDYELTYKADDLPTHYAFIVSWDVEALDEEYQRLLKSDPAELRTPLVRTQRPPKLSNSLTNRARGLVEALDERGAWVERGELKSQGADDATTQIIDTRTFAKNLVTLAQFVAASRL